VSKAGSEKTAWENEKKAGLEEVKKLREKVAEIVSANPASAEGEDAQADPKSANPAGEDQMDVEESPVEQPITETPQEKQITVADNEDAIEY